MIDLLNEQTILLRDVPNFLPLKGTAKIHRSTPFRWASKGVRGPDGQRVVLESRKAGGARVTSIEKLAVFMEKLSGQDLGEGHEAMPIVSARPSQSRHTSDILRKMDEWKPGDRQSKGR